MDVTVILSGFRHGLETKSLFDGGTAGENTDCSINGATAFCLFMSTLISLFKQAN